jgi:hypothetical protein
VIVSVVTDITLKAMKPLKGDQEERQVEDPKLHR